MEYIEVAGMEVTTLERDARGLPALPMLGIADVPLDPDRPGGAVVGWPVIEGPDGPMLMPGDDADVFDWRAIP